MRKQCLFSLAHATDDDDDDNKDEDEDDNGDDSMQFPPRVERGAREGGRERKLGVVIRGSCSNNSGRSRGS